MNEQSDKKELVDLFKENWLSFVLAGAGLVLVMIGGVVMLKEGSFQSGKEIVIEEESVTGEKIHVDIEGAVLNPGVYELPFSSRVQDLLISAGGLSKEADREWTAKNLNKAAKLKDGEKFYIPKKDESQVKGSQLSVTDKININKASTVELKSLSGIGDAYSQRIVDNRPYINIEELKERKIIPASTFEKIKDKISVY